MCEPRSFTLGDFHPTKILQDNGPEKLARELVRARLNELASMKEMLDKMRYSLEVILAVQLKFQARVEEEEESGHEMGNELAEGQDDQKGFLSFGVLLEMAVDRLQG
ncbi:hypothetical protein DVH05_007709 [Phytophthora capsici]|nr:hypothetical protein DVH05_007709 [Phytophthora capsici]|eukprot:jgi/Phyca11/131880/e_gw1.119.43.1